MRRFDPSSYLAEVLAPSQGSAVLPDLFTRYGLEVDDADEAAIAARLEEVKRYWDKKSEHPRYGATIRQLTDRHGVAKLTLLDARERERAAAEVREQLREAEEAAARSGREWDELLAQTIDSMGGLQPAQRVRLEKVAANMGVPADEAKAKLDAAPAAPEPKMLDSGQRETISRALNDLARDVGEPRMGLSLFHALALEITDDIDAVRERHEAQARENRVRPHGNTKAHWESVLSLVKLHLLEGDPRAYVHGLRQDVCEALEVRAIKAVTNDGEIDEVEAEQLLREAIALGLTQEIAREAVAELARQHGAGLRTGAIVDFVACPSCNTPHPREGGDERCRRCGAALFVACPNSGCGQLNDATAPLCSSCGTDLHRHAAATRALARLASLVDEGRVNQAREELAEATRVLGRSHAEVESVAPQVTVAVEKAKRGWAEAEAALADRRQYAARGLLTELDRSARDFPGPGGELPVQALATVRQRLAEAEALLGKARESKGEARERALSEALRVAADCAEAERELDKMPPEPAGEVEASAAGHAISVRWAASPTAGVRYLVTRTVIDGGPRGAVGETDQLQIEDKRAKPGTQVRYSVEAVRGRARSPAVSSEPVGAVYEVSNLRVNGGDDEVRLAWDPLEDGRVIVIRRDDDGGERELAPDAAGLTDRSVRNGHRYVYAVHVEYAGLGGELVRTPGLPALAEPVARPTPLSALTVHEAPAGVKVEFDRPESGTVTVVRCSEDPELEPGVELNPSRLSELGEVLAVSGSQATDPNPPSGSCFYQVVTVAAGIAIAGVAVRHVSLPTVVNVKAVASGGKARVTWSWPDGISFARVIWRHDRRPDGPGDPDAEAIDYRLGEYRDAGGCTIELGEQRSLFVAVCPAARVNGEVVYGAVGGKGSRDALRSTRKTELRYSVRRPGKLRKRLEVDVAAPSGEDSLPEMVLIGREGEILPGSAADGDVLTRLGGDRPNSSSLDLKGLSKPLAVRLFLDSSSAAGSFVVFDPMVDELVIR